MESNRCGHFSIEVEMLPVSNTTLVLRVPIRRCALAERMIYIIAGTEEGREVARKLIITASNLTAHMETGQAQEAAAIQAEMIRVAFGPDLEAIHASECTVQRCQESCTPSYRLLLHQFGCDRDAEQETGAGCLDLGKMPSDALRAEHSDS